ncbi:MAG TPA: M17 family peptidase N-terminal domain-containing protein, partial [Gemmatimonadaceae bacterium]|nr:M17 family peptidase N-terminal domain-containing protein [Gemmatimonadaceae bacterium]
MTLALTARRADFATLDAPFLVVALASSPSLTPDLAPIDAATGGALGRALARRDFRGARDETLHLSGGERGIQRVFLVGMGKPDRRLDGVRRAAMLGARNAARAGTGSVAFYA